MRSLFFTISVLVMAAVRSFTFVSRSIIIKVADKKLQMSSVTDDQILRRLDKWYVSYQVLLRGSFKCFSSIHIGFSDLDELRAVHHLHPRSASNCQDIHFSNLPGLVSKTAALAVNLVPWRADQISKNTSRMIFI